MSFKYFKILDQDIYAIDEKPIRFEIGKTYDIHNTIPGSNHLHFFQSMNIPYSLWRIEHPRFFEISITGDPIDLDSCCKYTSDKIKIMREIPIPEIRKEARKFDNQFCKQILCLYGTSKDLDVLVHDADRKLRILIAKRHIGKYLDILMHDSDPYVRCHVLQYKRPDDIKNALSDPDADVRSLATKWASAEDIAARRVYIDGKAISFEKAHKMLWAELSETEGMTEYDFFKNHTASFIPINSCFACESCGCDCKNCPIEPWREFSGRYAHVTACIIRLPDSITAQDKSAMYSGLYEHWHNAVIQKSYKKACKLAKRIAKLKWSVIS